MVTAAARKPDKAPRRVVQMTEDQALSPLVRQMRFRVMDGSPLTFVAGQWVNLYLPTPAGEVIERSYSLSSAPDPRRPDEFEVAVTRVDGGPGSTALHGLPPGAQVEMAGPHGIFTRRKGPPDLKAHPAVFVGTGTGLSPLRSMLLDELAREPEGPPMTLLFGCRTEEDILWRDELTWLAQALPRFNYEITLSRPSPSWSGRRGYVQHHLQELVAGLDGAHVYICGLKRMIDEVRSLLKTELGFDRKQIHTERFD
ncbi:MAG TPA: FAD-dependent oxidoreductase [Polyangiaceae bacterium LLY-WYZ-14_1]|jgi:ferredoxin-NADP reductase|nr:FAD-dependent oxidoreductase [Polyangiaceae bacterium LLY-WYZ-14_1]